MMCRNLPTVLPCCNGMWRAVYFKFWRLQSTTIFTS